MALRTIARKDRKNIRNTQRTPHKSALRTSKSPLFRSRLPAPAIPGRNRGCVRPGENAGPMPAPPCGRRRFRSVRASATGRRGLPVQAPFRRPQPPSGIAPAISENPAGTRQKSDRSPADLRQAPLKKPGRIPASIRQKHDETPTESRQECGRGAATSVPTATETSGAKALPATGRPPESPPRSPGGTKLRETPPEQRRARTIRQTGGRGRSKPYRENRPATRNDPESGSQNRLGRPIIA